MNEQDHLTSALKLSDPYFPGTRPTCSHGSAILEEAVVLSLSLRISGGTEGREVTLGGWGVDPMYVVFFLAIERRR